ncbi:hypothetical protein ACG2F4_17495 [Halalkalibaculum sp. DA3122]|uniref:baeRF7 domain-containing protein n=1 Tax=unclassified Halalkalibaculum TaxID=2964617 RepID=UPI003754C80F
MITKDIILDIIEHAAETSISIFLPTHKTGEEVQQDPIRLKNKLNNIEADLSESGMKKSEIDNLLEGPRKLLDQPLFWQHNDRGLALFLAEDYFEYFRVPLDFNPRYLIDNYFLVTPLLPMITLEGTFCILVISQKKVRLLKATRDSVEALSLTDSPTSIEEFKQYDVVQRNLQHHSGQGQGPAIFHGQGSGSDYDRKIVEEYLKTVETEVTNIMRRRNDPLILAGVDEAVSIYRKSNHYSRLLDSSIKGNPDPKSDEEIRDEGWEIIKSYFLKDMYSDIERFGDLSGSMKRSEDLSYIVEGAYYGKIDSLFVPIGEHSWGKFDAVNDVVHLSHEQENGEHDLINLAAIKTITQGGDVYALHRDDMPNNAYIAAIFRY